MKTKQIILTVLLTLTLFFANNVQNVKAQDAVYCTNCSTTWTQMMEHVTSKEELAEVIKQYQESIKQTANQLEQIRNQIKQYENMVHNTLSIPKEYLSKIAATYGTLARLTGQLSSLKGDLAATGNIFKDIYPDLDYLKNLAQASPDQAGAAASQYYQKWEDWSKKIDDASQATFQLTASQLNELTDGELEKHVMSLLDAASQGGQKTSLDAANQLSALQIQEAREFRSLMATGVQADVQRNMKEEKQEQIDKELKKALNNLDQFKNVTGANRPEFPQ